MNTPARSIRVPDHLWQAAQRTAAHRRETLTAVVVKALERYARDELRAAPKDES